MLQNIMLNNKNLLITGGTGSFGQAVKHVLLKYPKIKKLVILSRDELKQHQMSLNLSLSDLEKVRFFRRCARQRSSVNNFKGC